VNGTGIPEVKFDIGESYAGLLPIGDANDTNKLYFWFFPSTNQAAQKEITFWITGGVSPTPAQTTLSRESTNTLPHSLAARHPASLCKKTGLSSGNQVSLHQSPTNGAGTT